MFRNSSSTFNIQHLEDPLAWEGQRAEGHQLVLAFCLCLTPFFQLGIKFFVLPFRAVKMSIGSTLYLYIYTYIYRYSQHELICPLYSFCNLQNLYMDHLYFVKYMHIFTLSWCWWGLILTSCDHPTCNLKFSSSCCMKFQYFTIFILNIDPPSVQTSWRQILNTNISIGLFRWMTFSQIRLNTKLLLWLLF